MAKEVCDICGASRTNFIDKDGYKQHVKKHKEDVHECPECRRKCKTVQALKDHKRDVHGDPFKCPCCGKLFKTKHSMKKHQAKFEQECVLCNKKFKNKESFKQHMQQHSLATTFECDTCNKTFNSNSLLRLHVRTAHEANNTCTVALFATKHFQFNKILNVMKEQVME